MAFSEPPGSYDICPICFWEDDSVQLRWTLCAGGANKPSLFESQRNYAKFGAMEERFMENVRQPCEGDKRDEAWRPLDPEQDQMQGLPKGGSPPWPEDLSALYYWRSPAT